ncbi:FISUMP domain-containing protein [Marinifilum caeruleilacunae]|nr:FISUMP domain-containing protein [Marinifilum caeruleilacunae]
MNKTTLKSTLVYLMCVSLFVGCSKDDNEEGESPVFNIVKEKVSGNIQKGPYINGTSIAMSELDEHMSQTGKVFNSQIIDNKGSFEIKNIELSSQYVQFKADGYYFNEVEGDKSVSPLTLYALSDIKDKSSINVNVITHLEKSRVEYLIENDYSFEVAKDSAQKEIFNIFGFTTNNRKNSEILDISKNDDANAILLAISVILQGNYSVADLTENLANISSDIREDGILNNEDIKSSLYNSTSLLNLGEIRTNLEKRYMDLGFNASIPDFETKISEYLISHKPFDIEALVKDVTCNGSEDGSISLTINEGTAPFSYLWSNGATSKDISELSPGTYNVFITDAKGYKMNKRDIVITEPMPLAIDLLATHVTTPGGSDGEIKSTVSGGTSPYSYTWSNGETTENLSNISSGIYSITIVDFNKCEVVDEVAVQEPVNLEYVKTDISCNGSGNGEIDMTITGGVTPYVISWSNGSSSEDISNLEAGSYVITVEDKLGFTVSETIEINEPEPIEIQIEVVNTTLSGDDGEINIEVSGGTPPYNYSWSNGESTQDIKNLQVGFYTLTITDENQCTLNKKIGVAGTIADVDGNQYETVVIGSQIWMAENLKTTHYRNGDPIPTVDNWINHTSGAYCYYDNDESNADIYGALYNYYAIDDERNICPEGWHVPSDEEFKMLEETLGGEMVAGGEMKEEGLLHWDSPNEGATNSSGFTALPAGCRWTNPDNPFQGLGERACFWTSTKGEHGDILAWSHSLNKNGIDVFIMQDSRDIGFSLRCIKD